MLLKELSELLYIQCTRWRVCQCSFCKSRVLSTIKHVLVEVTAEVWGQRIRINVEDNGWARNTIKWFLRGEDFYNKLSGWIAKVRHWSYWFIRNSSKLLGITG